MKRLKIILLMLLALPAWLSAAGTDEPVPQQDLRAIRELQSQAFGTPSLPSNARQGEAVLALAELSGELSNSASNLQSSDYDALFALLQRYRDELVKMGLDASELDTQMKILKVRADELQERLDQLHPKDGLKISGRLYAAYDDLHILGPGAIAGTAGINAKPAGVGIRNWLGVVHAEIKLTATRGPLSGYVQFDMVSPWGLTFYTKPLGVRRIYLEMRMPITVQFGNIDSSLTPLTLWRDEDKEPFEPEPFKSRRQRQLDDAQLVPNKWTLDGGRISTEMLLFGAQKLDLESVSAVVGLANQSAYTGPPVNFITSVRQTHYNTYFEGWRAILPLFGDMLKLSDNGALFWDDTGTFVYTPAYRSTNAMTQSFKAELKKGIYWGDLEYALSNYTPAIPVTSPVVAATTGTAATYAVGVTTAQGHFKVFGRMVSSNFYSAGAQGRTEDNSFQFLGPFLTENSQIDSSGGIGVDGNIKPSFESRLNTNLIPPGVAKFPAVPNPWYNLLPYGFWETMDPYGDATPNRQGFGAEGAWAFFSGILTPKASYELISEIDPVVETTDTVSGLAIAPFNMVRMRAGAVIDCKPMFGWPLRFNAGYTSNDSQNGTMNSTGSSYDLNSTLLEGGADYDFANAMGLNLGYREFQVKGINDTFNFVDTAKGGSETWTIYGLGLWWKPEEDLRFDAVYSVTTGSYALLPTNNIEVDQTLVRLTLGF